MDKNTLKKQKEKLKKQKEIEKLKKQKEIEKLKKQKDKEKLKKQKDKEKLKKQKEKLNKQKRKIRKKKYKGGEVITRQQKAYLNTLLTTWQREDDADDYFEMWEKHFNTNSTDSFMILNYNLLRELQQIKDLIIKQKSCSLYSFRDIMKLIESYSFLTLLAETIDNNDIYDDNKKKLLFIKILKNLINIYILLTNNIFNPIIFPIIGKSTYLYRSWRNNAQLESMKSLNDHGEIIRTDILITDNYLSTSLDKKLALKFYKNSSGGRKTFTLWEIEITPEYPNLHVSTELNEILLHIGSILQFMGSETYSSTIDGEGEYYDITVERYKYMGFDKVKTNQVLNKFRDALNILEQVSGHSHPRIIQTSIFKKKIQKTLRQKK